MILAKRLAFGMLLVATVGSPALAGAVKPPARERFATASQEVPDFQQHVLPLLGRLGCNSRSCHGSFQGQGGFRLSLFGYDFAADHAALLAQGEDRVDPEAPEVSLILQKATEAVPHKGGKRFEPGDWSARLLERWIAAGAPGVKEGAATFDRIEVTPAEIAFDRDGQTTPLRVVAHWSDGHAEDVTCLSRFQSNDESVATVGPHGLVASAGRGDTHVVAFYDNGVLAVPVLRPVSEQVGPNYPEVPTRTEVDRQVVSRLRKLGIVPSELCTDAEFLRRVSLDLTGSLPAPAEVQAFVADQSPDKRPRKVDELLARPTYAAWWTNRLCDLMGNTPRNFQGMASAAEMARNWYAWIARRVGENRPYDEIVAGIVLGVSREPGKSYDDYIAAESGFYRKENPADYATRSTTPYFWARRNLRQPEEKALALSYAFLGVRLECAQCHKHPFDQWTQQDFDQFKAFFAPIRYERNRDYQDKLAALEIDPKQGNNKIQRELDRMVTEGKVVPWAELAIQQPRAPRPMKKPGKEKDQAKGRVQGAARVPTASVLGGETVDLSEVADPRAPLMEWMRDAENPYFARAFVNRVWALYFGRGIVHPADDSNLANPPANAGLLDHLTRGFVASRFDMKWLHREIVNSDTYQRSWRTNASNATDERHFSHAVVRRLPAEAVLDAIRQATASAPLLEKMGSDMELRSFGPRGTASYGRGGADYAARVFGRSARDTNCDCSRSDEPNLLQAIYLQNDSDVHTALERPDGWIAALTKSDSRAAQAVAPAGERDPAARIAAIEERLVKLGNNPKRAEARERLRAELAGLKSRTQADRDPPAAVDAARSDALIGEAFLRTLSRQPTPDELAASRAAFGEASGTAEALRDLMWALLNTREFVTNH
jgi:hypothetical protein